MLSTALSDYEGNGCFIERNIRSTVDIPGLYVFRKSRLTDIEGISRGQEREVGSEEVAQTSLDELRISVGHKGHLGRDGPPQVSNNPFQSTFKA